MLGCSCKKCHADRNPLLVAEEEEDPSEGTCWKDVLAEYECDICFEVLVGVHVLGDKTKQTGRQSVVRLSLLLLSLSRAVLYPCCFARY